MSFNSGFERDMKALKKFFFKKEVLEMRIFQVLLTPTNLTFYSPRL